MVRSGETEAGDTTGTARAVPLPTVGKIRSFAGSVSVARADGTAVRVEVGSALSQGDRIETGSDGRVGITFNDGTEFNLASDAQIELREFDGDPDSAQARVSQGRFAFVAGKQRGFSLETPRAMVRASPQACAVATLTLVGFTIALLQKLEAASNDSILLDELIKYKDHLQHGDLLIIPHGGKPVLLDDPELTIVVDANFVVTTLANSPVDMARLLGISAEGNNTYELGLADPFTTGSTDRAETHLFLPGLPNITLASNPTQLLPPVEDDPSGGELPDTGGNNNVPPPPVQQTLVLTPNTLQLSQDETPGTGTTDPFPVDDLAEIPGGAVITDLGRTQFGTAEDPFVSTAGSVFTGTLTITLEASTEGVDSGLDVTGGGSIFLFTETTPDGDQVVVGREGGADGPIAFILFVTEDGQTLWVQQALPIDHGPDGNDFDSMETIINSALLVRATVTGDGPTLTQTLPVGNKVIFEDDGPVAVDDTDTLGPFDNVAQGNVITDDHAGDVGDTDNGADTPGTDGGTITGIQSVNLPANGDTGADGDGNFQVTGEFGTLEINEDGTYTYTRTSLFGGVDVFTYTLTDGDTDFTTATLTVTLDDVNFIPEIVSADDAAVDEDGLGNAAVDGVPLNPGETDSTESNTFAGTFVVNYGTATEATGSSIELLDNNALDGQLVALNGNDVTFALDGDGKLVGTATGIAGPIITIEITGEIQNGAEVTYDYLVTLHQPIQHPINSTEDIDSVLGVEFEVTDGLNGDTNTGTFDVDVVDDKPIALGDSAEVQAQTTLATVNALFILDKSGSMGSDGDPDSRISLAKAAILDFASQSNVLSIRVLPFDSPADAPSAWFDLTQPGALEALEAYLDAITGSGGTNYEDAVYDAQQTWTAPPNDADLTNVYFISDGDPTSRSNNGVDDGNAGGSGSSNGLTSQEKAAWETFLNDNNIDNAYAVAIGTGINDIDLQEVAYPNTPTEANNVIVIDSAGDLSATLLATTQSSTTIPGNVVDGVVEDDVFGADGPGFVKTLRWDSDGDDDVDAADAVGYRFDGNDIYLNDVLFDDNASEVTFTTVNGGTMSFDFLTGDWEYTTPDTVNAPFDENFAYTIVDDDGDESAPATLDITVLPPPPIYTLAGAPDVTEGSALIFTLTLSNASSTDTVFKLATINGSATGDADFETSGFRYRVSGDVTWINAANGDEVTIPAGETAIEIEVDTSNDAFDEPNNESMQLVVQSVVSGSVSSVGNDDDETGLIDDNDPTPTLSISNGTTSAALAGAASPLIAPVNEGEFAYFQLKLSSLSGADIVVRLDTDSNDGGGSSPGGDQAEASGGSDYVTEAFQYSIDGGLNWIAEPDDRDVRIPSGMTSILVRISTVENSTFESLEAFRVDFVSIQAGSAALASGQAPDGSFGGIGEIQIADDDNAVPSILGGDEESYSIPENTTFVADVDATDQNPGDTLTYSIVNTTGTDFDKFTIDPSTGVLSFITPPDFENPNDVGGTNNNNIYVVNVQVSDGQATDTQTINVTVTDVGVANSNAGNDIVRTAASGAGSTTVVPEWALLYDDLGLFDVTATGSVNDLTSASLLAIPGSVTIVNNDTDGGSFTYTATGGDETDTAGVSVEIDTGSMDGSGFDEILVGTAGAQTIDGNGGDDILIGGGGGDTLIGGSGDDLIVYAAGVVSINGESNSSSNLLQEGNRSDILSVSGIVDFTSLADVFEDIETISMLASDGSAGNSAITLNITDVLDMSDSATANPGGSNGGFDFGQADALRIDGSAGDVLNLGPDAGTWLLATGATGIPAGYVAYAHVTSGSTPSVNEDAYLFVATGISVNGVGT